MKKLVDDPGGPVSPAARKKQKKSESRRAGKEVEAKGVGPTSKAARKTTVRRDGGESRSS
jgi:hypothetical protein